MAVVRLDHKIGRLASDLAKVPPRAQKDLAAVVRRNTKYGETVARRFAREGAGPHGANYFKRYSSESSGLVGEYGPTGTVRDNAVGAGWRNGPPNTDLERSQDIVGPKLAADTRDAIDGWFWL